jgi:DNA-binding CsgD family transcriptional regulator
MKRFLAIQIIILTVICNLQTNATRVKSFGVPFIKNYDVASIQTGSQTWGIDISPDGLAYFANNDGVVEFDGLNWRKYPMPNGTVVRSVKVTPDGRIYAGAFNQFGYFLPDASGKLVFNPLQDLLPPGNQNFEDVWRIYDLPIGVVFQTFQQLMVYSNDEIKTIDLPGSFHFSFLVKGELYLNDQDEGLFRLAGERLVKVPGTGFLKGKLIWSMLPKGDNILIATANEGIFEFDGLKLWEWNNQASDFLRENQVYCGTELDDATYVFGTIQDGILICDTAGKIMQHISMNCGLQNSTVLSIKIDQYKNLWLGLDNGIDYVETNSPLSIFSYFNRLSAGYAAILHDGNLYFGTNRGLFYLPWQALETRSNELLFDLVPGTQGQVWKLMEIDGTLFCGHNSGIFVVDDARARLISEVQGGWTFIQPDGKKDIIIAGTYTNLVRFRKVNGQWQNGEIIAGFKESSRSLANAGNNALWMAHGYKGVYRIQFNDDYDSVLSTKFYDEESGFVSNRNINVFEVSGKPVFTTDDGFFSYDSQKDQFRFDKSMNEKFPGGNILQVNQDKSGNVWFFTDENAGVFRLQEDGSYATVSAPFRELEGRFIKGFQFVYPLNEEHVFFGIQNGFAHYNPEYPKDYQQSFKSFIRSVQLSGSDSVLFYGNSPGEVQVHKIPFSQNEIRFEFSANDFENPGSLEFTTRLEGFDTDWQAWSDRAVREFTNLDYGSYNFQVKAINIFGTESSVSSYPFKILPPWYLSWQGYVLYFSGFLIFIYLMGKYVRMRMEKSKRLEEERQKRLFREREKQLQTEALEAEKEVIRLRNEKLRAEMRQKDKELANSTMQMIQKSKSLSSIKKELNKLSKEINDDLITNHINSMVRKINREMDTEQQWEVFEKHFESVHEEFLKRLKEKYPDLTPREMKLCAYLRLNISSKEIATLMNISTRGVEISRYRLRKKLNLAHDTNLTEFIMGF